VREGRTSHAAARRTTTLRAREKKMSHAAALPRNETKNG